MSDHSIFNNNVKAAEMYNIIALFYDSLIYCGFENNRIFQRTEI